MIRSFRDAETEKVFRRERARKLPHDVQRISVPSRWINEIVHGKRAVPADTALRLARCPGTSERFWLNLQARCELEVERDRPGYRLAKEVRILAG